jgi:cbb3-type cytochrome oxidase subunit 3
MRLSDVIGSLDIATYPQIALVIFLAIFISVCWRLLRHTTSQQMHAASMIPLEETKRVEDQ